MHLDMRPVRTAYIEAALPQGKNMADQIRLDRFLADAGIGSRAEVKKLIRSGRVFVNTERAKQSEQKVSPDQDEILVDQAPVRPSVSQTLMLNKPAGVISATKDAHEKTVLDLIQEPYASKLHPVGRLDKDTEGLLLLTEDGALSHALLSPKKHVVKTYFAVVSGAPDQEIIRGFRDGIGIGEKKKTLPARLVFLSAADCAMTADGEETVCTAITADSENTACTAAAADAENSVSAHVEITGLGSISPDDLARCKEGECCAVVSISEGKFHQIKRMFGAFGRQVLFLKRLSMGAVVLDPCLKPGQYRPLTEEERKLLTDAPHAVHEEGPCQ